MSPEDVKKDTKGTSHTYGMDTVVVTTIRMRKMKQRNEMKDRGQKTNMEMLIKKKEEVS